MKRTTRTGRTGKILLALAALALSACQPSDKTVLTPVRFAELPGWEYDQQAEALKVFADSCRTLETRAVSYMNRNGEDVGDRGGWARACEDAYKLVNAPVETATAADTLPLPAVSDEQARAFFEMHFTPFQVSTGREPKGLLTGYYEPMLFGSMVKDARFNVPVYGLPEGFEPGAEYPSREEITRGALDGRAPVLLYVDDPVMLFFLHIQGSGKVILPDGKIVGLQYAGQNGHGYVAIGGVMRDEGYLEEVSLQTIRDFLKANPDLAPDIMNINPSYIFFKLAPGEEYAKGALGIPLTPMRSVAVDDDRAAYGVPTYIATTHMNYFSQSEEPLHRLMVSQDTGGALKGPHRGDIFFGRGNEAEWAAGQQAARGDVYWLLPRSMPLPPAAEPVSEPALLQD